MTSWTTSCSPNMRARRTRRKPRSVRRTKSRKKPNRRVSSNNSRSRSPAPSLNLKNLVRPEAGRTLLRLPNRLQLLRASRISNGRKLRQNPMICPLMVRRSIQRREKMNRLVRRWLIWTPHLKRRNKIRSTSIISNTSSSNSDKTTPRMKLRDLHLQIAALTTQVVRKL